MAKLIQTGIDLRALSHRVDRFGDAAERVRLCRGFQLNPNLPGALGSDPIEEHARLDRQLFEAVDALLAL